MGETRARSARASSLGAAFDARARRDVSTDDRARDRVAARLFPGARFGRYRVVHQIGAGGFGVVYAAHDPGLERRVAIKVIRAGGLSSDARARIDAEARSMAQVSHPCVVEVYDVGWKEDRFYLVMELVDGPDLGTWCRQTRSPRELVDAFIAAARGLQAIHARGIVHRDFKPSNVLIAPGGAAKVTDFGLARVLDTLGPSAIDPSTPLDLGDPTGLPITFDSIAGTPAFMSPEQHRGQPVDERTDVYAFGIALATALQGQHPFTGVCPDILLEAKLRDEPVLPVGGGVPRHVTTALRRAIRADASERFATMTDVIAALNPAPSRLRRWALLGLAGIGVAGVFVATPVPTAPTCDPGRRTADALVSARALFADLDDDTAGQQRARLAVAAALDEYAAAWTLADQRACGERPVDPAKVQCLQHELRALVDDVALATTPEGDPVQVLVAVSALAPPGRCLELPRSPPIRSKEVESLLSGLRRAALSDGGVAAETDAIARLDDLLTDGDLEGRAELHLHRASALWESDTEKLLDELESAYRLAREAGANAVADAAALGLAQRHAQLGRLDVADRWLREADAVSAGQRSVMAELRRSSVQFDMEAARGDSDAALATGRALLDHARAVGLSGTRPYFRMMGRVLELERLRTRLDPTLEARIRAYVGEAQEAFGEASPETSQARRVLAGFLLVQERYDDAAAELDAARAIAERLGEPAMSRGWLWIETARARSIREVDLPRAIAAYGEAMRILGDVVGADTQALILTELVEVEVLAARYDDARIHAERAAAMLSEVVPTGHVSDGYVTDARARVAAAQQRWLEAEALSSRAAGVMAAGGAAPWKVAEAWARAALARAHLGQHGAALDAANAAEGGVRDNEAIAATIGEARAIVYAETGQPTEALEAVAAAADALRFDVRPRSSNAVMQRLAAIRAAVGGAACASARGAC